MVYETDVLLVLFFFWGGAVYVVDNVLRMLGNVAANTINVITYLIYDVFFKIWNQKLLTEIVL